MEQSLSAEHAAVRPSSWRPGLVFALLLSYFGIFGCVVGGLGVLWSEIVAALRLSNATFGSAQLTSPLISVGLLLAGGYLSGWAGKKRLALSVAPQHSDAASARIALGSGSAMLSMPLLLA